MPFFKSGLPGRLASAKNGGVKRKFIAVLASCCLALPAWAATNNPNTDWFLKAGYGVFVHYLEDLQNDPQQIHSLGRRTSWDECVREFDVNRFADAMAEAGAGYVIFTMHQRILPVVVGEITIPLS